jgi:hypothetical protein
LANTAYFNSIEFLKFLENDLTTFYFCSPHIGSNWANGQENIVMTFNPTGLTIFLPFRKISEITEAVVSKFIETDNPKSFYLKNPEWLTFIKQLLRPITPHAS